MTELKLMALDSVFPSAYSLFEEVNYAVASVDFDEEKLIYPVGIIDVNYEWFDEETAVDNDWISFTDGQFSDNVNAENAYSHFNSQVIAPLFDWFDAEPMGLVFRRQNFYSNYRSVDSIASMRIKYKGRIHNVSFDDVFEFTPDQEAFQLVEFQIFYTNGDSIVTMCKINTPELIDDEDGFTAKSLLYPFPKHIYKDKIGLTGNPDLQLEYCFIPSFCNPQAFVSSDNVAYKPIKPYILVTGYRPPAFGQSFDKTWSIYNNNHAALLHQLRLNGYDIILVRFNMYVHPFQLGLPEMAELFKKFLYDLNAKKEGDMYNENVIQGSSMGASIVQSALIRMENEHFYNNAPHHHSRLFITYDGDYYGANIPLAYQAQIYSGVLYRSPLNYDVNVVSVASGLLRLYLLSSMAQKATKELLMYHIQGIGNESFFDHVNTSVTWTPTYTSLRQSFLNGVQSQYDQLGYYPKGKHLIPLPSSTRNVAISLGKIETTNDVNTGLDFNSAGENWRNVDLGLYKHILRAAQYHDYNNPEGGKLIFKRLIGINTKKVHLNIVNEELRVFRMQEIDNASGSYLKSFGNVLAITNIAYGFNWFNIFDQPKFTHKSVLSALAVNPAQWPANGSHTLNIQNLNLMYNSFGGLASQNQSNHFGYPNLGRPNDHFAVTPFEAIYVGEKIYPHISLKKADAVDIEAINDFVKNEVEPWYLGLQNERLGEQARSNYTYKVLRRAKNTITTGNLVTPKTDQGDYVVMPNTDLRLEAGQQIVLKPGTHIMAGAKAHLKIVYDECVEPSGMATNNQTPKEKEHTDIVNSSDNKMLNTNEVADRNITIYPNPTIGSFTVEMTESINLQTLTIYAINGQLVDKVENINVIRYVYEKQLKQGTYLLVIQANDNKIIHKKLIVL
jgi:hypothetical protein